MMELMSISPEAAGKVIWLCGLMAWLAIRYRPNRVSRKSRISRTMRGKTEIFSMAMSFTGLGLIPLVWILTNQIASFNYQGHWIPVLSGIILFASSLYLFYITHRTLGSMWSVSLDLRENHKLVTRGVYEKIRHPMYSAFWLWAIAQPFLLANWIAGFSGITGFGILYSLRLKQEERMMEEEFGSQYQEYRKRTKRIFPYLY